MNQSVETPEPESAPIRERFNNRRIFQKILSQGICNRKTLMKLRARRTAEPSRQREKGDFYSARRKMFRHSPPALQEYFVY
jgi:hypothetical protein